MRRFGVREVMRQCGVEFEAYVVKDDDDELTRPVVWNGEAPIG
jgi:hypothetical protein